MTDMSDWNDDAVWWGSKARQDIALAYAKWAKDALDGLGFDGALSEPFDLGNEIGVRFERKGKGHANRFKIHPNVITDVCRWARGL